MKYLKYNKRTCKIIPVKDDKNKKVVSRRASVELTSFILFNQQLKIKQFSIRSNFYTRSMCKEMGFLWIIIYWSTVNKTQYITFPYTLIDHKQLIFFFYLYTINKYYKLVNLILKHQVKMFMLKIISFALIYIIT